MTVNPTTPDDRMEAITKNPPPFLKELSERLGENNQEEMLKTIFSTAMYQDATKAEFRTFLMTANNLKLNPLSGEIFAFKKKGGGIQVIVGKDGWNTLGNLNPDYDGRQLFYYYHVDGKQTRFDHPVEGLSLVMTECHVYRKSRERPEISFAKMSEYNRPKFDTWQIYPTTMLEHKAYIKAMKAAFGYAGVVDADDARSFCDLRSSNVPAAAHKDDYYQTEDGRTERNVTPPEPTGTAPSTSAPAKSAEEETPLASSKQKQFIYAIGKKAADIDSDQMQNYITASVCSWSTLTKDQADSIIKKFWNKSKSEYKNLDLIKTWMTKEHGVSEPPLPDSEESKWEEESIPPDDEQIDMSFDDQGPGPTIDKRDRAKLFGLFRQLGCDDKWVKEYFHEQFKSLNDIPKKYFEEKIRPGDMADAIARAILTAKALEFGVENPEGLSLDDLKVAVWKARKNQKKK